MPPASVDLIPPAWVLTQYLTPVQNAAELRNAPLPGHMDLVPAPHPFLSPALTLFAAVPIPKVPHIAGAHYTPASPADLPPPLKTSPMQSIPEYQTPPDSLSPA